MLVGTAPRGSWRRHLLWRRCQLPSERDRCQLLPIGALSRGGSFHARERSRRFQDSCLGLVGNRGGRTGDGGHSLRSGRHLETQPRFGFTHSAGVALQSRSVLRILSLFIPGLVLCTLQPVVPECTFLCQGQGSCALGLECGLDGYCHSDRDLNHCVAAFDAGADGFVVDPPCAVLQPTAHQLNALYGISAEDVWAVGTDSNLVLSSWKLRKRSDGRAQCLPRSVGRKRFDIWIVGEDQLALPRARTVLTLVHAHVLSDLYQG